MLTKSANSENKNTPITQTQKLDNEDNKISDKKENNPLNKKDIKEFIENNIKIIESESRDYSTNAFNLNVNVITASIDHKINPQNHIDPSKFNRKLNIKKSDKSDIDKSPTHKPNDSKSPTHKPNPADIHEQEHQSNLTQKQQNQYDKNKNLPLELTHKQYKKMHMETFNKIKEKEYAFFIGPVEKTEHSNNIEDNEYLNEKELLVLTADNEEKEGGNKDQDYYYDIY